VGYWQGDSYLHGPNLAAWLEERLPPEYGEMWPALGWKIDQWKAQKRRAYLPHLEPDLCAIGIHPGEIPDALWNVDQSYHRGCPPVPPSPGTCRRGHPRTEENTYHRPDGRVECRDCKRSLRAEMAAA
jgi:hypothetical protein